MSSGVIEADLSVLEARLTAARAANLDNLAGGAVALDSDITTLTGLVDDLEGRLTAARALLLDKLNISGNVAGSNQVDALEGDTGTILGRLTSTRAAYLDNLSGGQANQVINSIQVVGSSSSNATTVNVTVSSVTTSKTLIIPFEAAGNFGSGNYESSHAVPYKAELTSSTNLRFTFWGNHSSFTVYSYALLLEFK